MLIDWIKDYLEYESEFLSLDLKFGDNLFVNFYPDNPDDILSVLDNGGFPPRLYVPVREKIIEFKFRTNTLQKGYEIGEELIKLFHDKENYYLNSKRILHSYARTDSTYLYKDKNERHEFSLEVVFLIEN